MKSAGRAGPAARSDRSAGAGPAGRGMLWRRV